MLNEYEKKTKDFYIACLLRALNFNLLRLDRESNNIATFVFSDPQNKADSTIQKYWDRELMVEARVLIDSIHELKTRLHSRHE